MKKLRFSTASFLRAAQAVLIVAAATAILLMIGRDVLGEAGIALLFLAPITWIAYQWGLLPGICAALTAALAFDFFFIPPFNTFAIARLEGWLVLAIFLGVAILVVGRIQASLTRAQTSEREIMLMYELSVCISQARTVEAMAYNVTHFMRESYLASRAKVTLQPYLGSPEVIVCEPRDAQAITKPDRTLPILNAWGLVGAVQIWHGDLPLPAEDSRIMHNFASQIGQALERLRVLKVEAPLAQTNTQEIAP